MSSSTTLEHSRRRDKEMEIVCSVDHSQQQRGFIARKVCKVSGRKASKSTDKVPRRSRTSPRQVRMQEVRRRTQTQSLLLTFRLVRPMTDSCSHESCIILRISTTLLLFFSLSACYGYWRLRSGLLSSGATTDPAR